MKKKTKWCYLLPLLIVIAGQAIAKDATPNCIIADDAYPFVVTQCADGTITVVNRSEETVKVCSKTINGSLSCQSIGK